MAGKLYLIPVPVYFDYYDSITEINIDPVIHRLRTFIVEDERTARRILKRAGFKISFDEISFLILNEHTKNLDLVPYLDGCMEGEDIGLMSESGMPCIADPGSIIVKIAHQKGIQIIPLSGDSSIMLSLMASGFNGQQFCFHGYLPIDKTNRIKTLKSLENNIYQLDQTQIFIETPYRNNQLLELMVNTLAGTTLLCVACNLRAPGESIIMKSISDWRHTKADLNKKPVVYLLYK